MGDVDVVIVGAGPTGNDARRGARAHRRVDVVVLERLAAPDRDDPGGCPRRARGRGARTARLPARRCWRTERGRRAGDGRDDRRGACLQRRWRAPPLRTMPSMAKIGGHFAGLFLIDQSPSAEPARRPARRQPASARADARPSAPCALGVRIVRGVELTGVRGRPGEAVEVHVAAGGRRSARARATSSRAMADAAAIRKQRVASSSSAPTRRSPATRRSSSSITPSKLFRSAGVAPRRSA